MKLTLATGAAVVLALAACQPDYAYLPVTNATVVRGKVAASYPIPADMPHGDVRVASYGIVDVGPRHPKNPADELRALHLRFTIDNNGDRSWTFDTSQQRIALTGYGLSAPAWVSASGGAAAPVVQVPAMQTRTVDLFFPLRAAHAVRARHCRAAAGLLWALRLRHRFVVGPALLVQPGVRRRRVLRRRHRPAPLLRRARRHPPRAGRRRVHGARQLRARAAAQPLIQARSIRFFSFSAIARANGVCGS